MNVKEITVAELASKFASKQEETFVLLDVREEWELALASLESALHIPMHQVPERLAELDKDQEIVVMCHHGGRSMQVAQYLAHQGFGNISNLTGGIHIWSMEIDTSISTY